MKEIIAQEEKVIDKPLAMPALDEGEMNIERRRLGSKLNTT